MYAVIKSGGKQYRVSPGDEVKIEKIQGEVGEEIRFDSVLLVSDGEQIQVGRPYLDQVEVVGQITRQAKDRKVVVVKFKRRKNYRRKKGHRQPFTLVRIQEVRI